MSKKGDGTGNGGPSPIGQTSAGDPIVEHPLSKKLHAHPHNHEHLVTLTGYTGKSSTTGYVRLYLHHDFQSYFEIAEKDIRHAWPAITPGSTDPTNITIAASAEPKLVVHTLVTTAAAALLKGPMVTHLLAGAIEVATNSISNPWETTQPPPPPTHGVINRRLTKGPGEE